MQLKSIKAYGFKSFADKIEIEIKDGITSYQFQHSIAQKFKSFVIFTAVLIGI